MPTLVMKPEKEYPDFAIKGLFSWVWIKKEV